MIKKTILLTGGFGFIFSNFIRSFIYNKYDYNLVIIDKLMYPSSYDNIYINNKYKYYIGDIADTHFVESVFKLEKPDIVINGAASSFVDDSIKDPLPFINSNVLGTQVIVNACVKYNVEKLIYISTDEVYGQLNNEYDSSWTEESPINPRNPYSASKASGELIVKSAHETFGLKYNITRSSNNYGPRQTSDKLIPKTIKCILNGDKIPIYGKGLQVRDWTHVFDNCAALMLVLTKGADNEIYNISSNQEFSNIEVVQKICNTLGTGHQNISFVPERLGHDFRYSVNSNKIRKLGWEPQWKFSDGIVQTCEWFSLNKWFIK